MSLIRLILIVFLFRRIFAVDYCKLTCENATHTMCKYQKGPGKLCINYKKPQLTPGDKKYIVDIHNDIRNHIASGRESRGTLGSQPQAADMLLLQWDDELAEIAQRWADQCTHINSSIQHDVCKRTERFEIGQNILTAVTTDTELPELSILLLNWYRQVSNVIPTDVDYFNGIRRGKFLIGQYTQLVWAKTRFIGCGIAAFKEHNSTTLYHHRLVCNYGPAGNIIGQAVYQRGAPCSKCPFRNCDRLRTNLCQGYRNNETDTNITAITKISGETVSKTQSNNSIFKNDTNIFDTNVNGSLCVHAIINTIDIIKYAKCIIGIDTNITNTTETSSFPKIFKSSESHFTKKKQSMLETTSVPPTFHIHQKPWTEDDERMMIYIPEASNKIPYAIENRTYRYPHHRYYQRNTMGKRSQSTYNLTSAITRGDEIIMPDKRRFIKARGIWYNGGCRCNRIYRSHSEKLDAAYSSLIPTLFVYLYANIL